jgi:hypothetical protein
VHTYFQYVLRSFGGCTLMHYSVRYLPVRSASVRPHCLHWFPNKNYLPYGMSITIFFVKGEQIPESCTCALFFATCSTFSSTNFIFVTKPHFFHDRCLLLRIIGDSATKGPFPLERFAARKAESRAVFTGNGHCRCSVNRAKPSSMSLPVKITTADDSVTVKRSSGKGP